MDHLLDMPIDRLRDWFSEHGQPAFRAAQVAKWVFHRRADRFDRMTDLPAALRDELAEVLRIFSASIRQHRKADDGTEKLLLELFDGGRIECVLLRDGVRRTVCISSQVGCAMGCVFCASGLLGVDRNLTTGEIVEQPLQLARLLPEGERLSHVVVMGMGEPLANLDRLLPALDRISSPEGLGISARRITISTVGLPKAIDRLIDRRCQYNLAVSLHAANDELRNRLVPANRKVGIAAVLDAADRYFESSGRRLTFEYVMLAGINDRAEDARQLATLLRGRPMLLNLIPLNPVANLPYETPGVAAVARFQETLENAGLNVQVRRRKGEKIDAACGQLRRGP